LAAGCSLAAQKEKKKECKVKKIPHLELGSERSGQGLDTTQNGKKGDWVPPEHDVLGDEREEKEGHGKAGRNAQGRQDYYKKRKGEALKTTQKKRRRKRKRRATVHCIEELFNIWERAQGKKVEMPVHPR